MEKIRIAYKIVVQNLKGEDHLEYLSVDGMMILKCILKK
jgi:hypothetical protein